MMAARESALLVFLLLAFLPGASAQEELEIPEEVEDLVSGDDSGLPVPSLEGTPGHQEPAPPGGDEPDFADNVQGAFADQALLWGVGLTATSLALLGFALVGRYVPPQEALKNPQREQIYEHVKQNSGVHLKKLSEEFAMKTSSVLWHMRKLECAELVRSERLGGFRVFYPVEGGVEARRVSRAVALLKNDNARRIGELVTAHPGASVRTIAETMGANPGTVRWHLRKLSDNDLVQGLTGEAGRIYYATARMHAALGGPTPVAVKQKPVSAFTTHSLE